MRLLERLSYGVSARTRLMAAFACGCLAAWYMNLVADNWVGIAIGALMAVVSLYNAITWRAERFSWESRDGFAKRLLAEHGVTDADVVNVWSGETTGPVYVEAIDDAGVVEGLVERSRLDANKRGAS